MPSAAVRKRAERVVSLTSDLIRPAAANSSSVRMNIIPSSVNVGPPISNRSFLAKEPPDAGRVRRARCVTTVVSASTIHLESFLANARTRGPGAATSVSQTNDDRAPVEGGDEQSDLRAETGLAPIARSRRQATGPPPGAFILHPIVFAAVGRVQIIEDRRL